MVERAGDVLARLGHVGASPCRRLTCLSYGFSCPLEFAECQDMETADQRVSCGGSHVCQCVRDVSLCDARVCCVPDQLDRDRMVKKSPHVRVADLRFWPDSFGTVAAFSLTNDRQAARNARH